MVATAQAWDDEMRLRISRHQADRAERVVGMQTVEEPFALGETIARLSQARTLIVVDCLTLWLTNFLMPMPIADQPASPQDTTQPITNLLSALKKAPGPVVLVGNEIGMGVIPMGAEVRQFVDHLGRLNQDVANACQRVTLMVAGQAMVVKDSVCSA
jgi:adenosylcobinamide kinase/adenosylcobinamide-phosphate guanylyltransferase